MLSYKSSTVLLMLHFAVSVSASWLLIWSFEKWLSGSIINPIVMLLALAASILLLLLLFPIGYAALLALSEFGWPAAVLVILVNSMIWIGIGNYIGRSISSRTEP